MIESFMDDIRAYRFAPPVRSLMDIDFYKFTMGNYIFQHHRGVEVTFELIVRDTSVPVHQIVPEAVLAKALDYARGLRFDYTQLSYLRGMRVYGANMFDEGYIEFLANLALPPYELKKLADGYLLRFTGPWAAVSLWETIALAVISALYYRELAREIPDHELEIIYARAMARLYEKFEKLSRYPGIRFADFGQRRRHSYLWQKWAVGLARKMLGDQFVGTSNTELACRGNYIPIGTNAHEVPMVLAALAEDDGALLRSQYRLLPDWQSLYGMGLRIFLPDTFGTAQFLAHAPEALAHDWRGMRQDSGDPVRAGHLYLEFLRRHGADPNEKLIIFSDGLDVDPMIALYEHFAGQINVSFGWGTLLTNDFAGCYPKNPLFRPFSMVCKVVEANGRPCVKLSDNVNKATGPANEVARYLRIFGGAGRTRETVVV